MICSRRLHVTEVNETGLYFSAMCLSPFLNTGVMLAFVQSCDRHPELNEVWNMRVKPVSSSVAHSLRKRHWSWRFGAVDLFKQAGHTIFINAKVSSWIGLW